MKKLILNTEREGYGTDQIEKTMTADENKMTLMEKKLRDQIKMAEYKIDWGKQDLEEKHKQLIQMAQGEVTGEQIMQIGKEMVALESDIRKNTEKKKMLEYALNDEAEA